MEHIDGSIENDKLADPQIVLDSSVESRNNDEVFA